MKLLRTSLLLLLVTTAVLSAEDYGFITDGNSLSHGIELYRKAKAGAHLTSEELVAIGSASGFLNGFVTSSHLLSIIDPAAPFKLPDDGISTLQALKVVEKYLADNPGKLHESAGILVLLALKESFPNPAYKK
jgi:hypothetical protein